MNSASIKKMSNQTSLREMIRESVAFLKENEPPEGYGVAFSGGKDSIVMYEIVKRSGVKFQTPHYSATGIDPPEVIQFMRKYYPEIKFVHPKEGFYKLIHKKGPPKVMYRWC
jgi:phosphoadenosine phosphosulfate reductase